MFKSNATTEDHPWYRTRENGITENKKQKNKTRGEILEAEKKGEKISTLERVDRKT